MKKKHGLALLLAAMAIYACRKPYNPPAIASPPGILVVEGIITGTDSTFITLSRTVNIAALNTNNPELHASVALVSNQGTTYPLTELGNGIYACPPINLSNTQQYSLTITTADEQRFASAYVSVINSPPIDSITYDIKGTPQSPGVNLYANTHDPTNTIKYYRWEYQETWYYHSQYASSYYSNGDTVLARTLPSQDITDCWDSDTSSSIVLGSTAKLAKAIVSQQLLTSVPSTSQKVANEYSIFVKQYALTPDAYIFYQNLQKNSEQLGGIFDAQPSQINGNLHCITNSSLPVIGYVSIGAITTKRIFISNDVLPDWQATPDPPGCELAFADAGIPCCYFHYISNPAEPVQNQVDLYINYYIGGDLEPLIPLSAYSSPGGPIIGYSATTKACADCTLHGTNVRPAFWQ
jgi:hypothetical protein